MRLVLTLLVLGTFACDRSPPPPAPAVAVASATPSSSSGTIDGARAKKLVREGAKLVDVRSPEEYAEKHVPGAENIPVDVIDGRDLGPKDKPIVVYCHSGRRSARAADTLRAKGYTNVHDLGAMTSWPSDSQ